jgi:hypothetical protein
MTQTIVNIIQTMLAPAIMISACGLLLLALNNKYSSVNNRIRCLNEENRKINKLINLNQTDDIDYERTENIKKQIELLLIRVKYVRNSVLFYSIAVGFFVIDSLLIGLPFFIKSMNTEIFSLTCFIIGMILVLTGVIFSASETWIGFKIIKIETSNLIK